MAAAAAAVMGWGGVVTWSSEGIYNKVALTVGLKTFTQVYISASATAIETRKVTQLNKEAPVCAFCVFFFFISSLMLVTG